MRVILAILACSLAFAVQADNHVDHEKIARNWLKLVDRGDYDSSWESADRTFQRRVSQDDWLNVIEYARDPLGKPVSRELISQLSKDERANRARTISLDFRTDFENRHVATERVTLQRHDNYWQVSSYLIH